MDPFKTVNAVAAPLDLANVNTDQIFPARFIKKPRSVGYAQFTFHDLRSDAAGNERADFPLNRERYSEAEILVCGVNFGCGSSREGAVYTLIESGIRVLIAPSFGDIFAANCLKNGLLTIVLENDRVISLREELDASERPQMSVDLEAGTITTPSGEQISFSPDPFQKHCLLNGLNEIDISLEFADEVDVFETAYRKQFPWTAPPCG
ncbi:MAG TPA: 3-isopropylmalate dehydratase small subunit [Afifellaceae bacterium]|nr:3-isopropylmalate dehydratase small subunit [Afifellaceae bacterium]